MLYSPADVRRWTFVLEGSEGSPEVIAAQKSLLREMRSFCESKACRHAALSSYFGQTLEVRNCGACDVCRPRISGHDVEDQGGSGESAVERDLFERLRTLRRTIAGERSVPSFIVFSDNTLREMARTRPQTLAAMKAVKGIGDRKLADVGARFVQEVRAYCLEKGLGSSQEAAAQPRLGAARQDGKPATVLSLTRRRAFDLFGESRPLADVADAIGRAPSTTRQYLIDFIIETRPGDVGAWVAPTTYERVAGAARREGLGLLKPVFEALGGEVPYEDIRIVMTHLRSLSGAVEAGAP
jgi:ATP-dependent DNA helicase RecQ